VSNTTHPTKIVTVTPEKAASWLRRHKLLETQDPSMRNRTVKEDKVRCYARDMGDEKWMVNGEPLIFAANGRILDGQHRLLACVEADKAFRTHVVENVSHEAMKTIDTGIGRSAGDQLMIFGKSNSRNLAVALGVLWRWEQTGKRGFEWRSRGTRLELFATLDRHPDIEGFVTKALKLERLMSGGLAAALWYIFSEQDDVLAGSFFEALSSGTNMQEGDPVYLLRERLIRDRQEQLTSRSNKQITMDYNAELVARAWDATKRGVKLAKLQRGSKNNQSNLLTRRTKKKV